MAIKQVGTAQVMSEGLAVVAIADHPIRGPRRGIGDEPANLPAAAPQLGLCTHDCDILSGASLRAARMHDTVRPARSIGSAIKRKCISPTWSERAGSVAADDNRGGRVA